MIEIRSKDNEADIYNAKTYNYRIVEITKMKYEIVFKFTKTV